MFITIGAVKGGVRKSLVNAIKPPLPKSQLRQGQYMNNVYDIKNRRIL